MSVSIRWKLLAADKQEIVVGYAANEPIQLKAQGFDVTELRVADYVSLHRMASWPVKRSLPKTPNW